MRKLTGFLLLILSIFLSAGMGSALEFTLDSYAVLLNTSDPGLKLDWDPILATPSNQELDLLVPYTFDLFEIFTTENSVDNDADQVPKLIAVEMNFTAPDIFGGSITGATFGYKSGFWGFYQGGEVIWDGPTVLNFGPIGDGELSVSLSDATFNEGIFWGTGCKGATVTATVLYSKEASQVPEPETMVILGFALMGLAGFGRRKFKK